MPSDSSTVYPIIMPESHSSKDQPNPLGSLQQQLRESFEQLGYPQLQAIECTVEDDTIRLTGELDSFYLKQVAQSVAMKIAGPHFIQNLIEVN